MGMLDEIDGLRVESAGAAPGAAVILSRCDSSAERHGQVARRQALCDTEAYSHPGRDGGTGRRSGLKIRRPLRPWGFDPPSRHQTSSLKWFAKQRASLSEGFLCPNSSSRRGR